MSSSDLPASSLNFLASSSHRRASSLHFFSSSSFLLASSFHFSKSAPLFAASLKVLSSSSFLLASDFSVLSSSSCRLASSSSPRHSCSNFFASLWYLLASSPCLRTSSSRRRAALTASFSDSVPCPTSALPLSSAVWTFVQIFLTGPSGSCLTIDAIKFTTSASTALSSGRGSELERLSNFHATSAASSSLAGTVAALPTRAPLLCCCCCCCLSVADGGTNRDRRCGSAGCPPEAPAFAACTGGRPEDAVAGGCTERVGAALWLTLAAGAPAPACAAF
mmetsp:Transcript_119702/g.298533  ORF Transcript_119702/g.298533 Transcript_119702/m.298533 type:complete len:278 (+) Transcript_119702:585-1418(+)